MRSFTPSEEKYFMGKAIGFFFCDAEEIVALELDSISGLEVADLEVVLSYYQVCEAYEDWDAISLCDEIKNLYCLLTSVAFPNVLGEVEC